MQRAKLKKGDKSSAGGEAIEGVENCTHYGVPFTYLGAKVQCPACQSTGTIVPKGPRRDDTMYGLMVALEGDLCQCNCSPRPVMIASQHAAYHSFLPHELTHIGYNANGHANNGSHDQHFQLFDEQTQEPLAHRHYKIVYSGGELEGKTDANGLTAKVGAAAAEEITIEIYQR